MYGNLYILPNNRLTGEYSEKVSYEFGLFVIGNGYWEGIVIDRMKIFLNYVFVCLVFRMPGLRYLRTFRFLLAAVALTSLSSLYVVHLLSSRLSLTEHCGLNECMHEINLKLKRNIPGVNIDIITRSAPRRRHVNYIPQDSKGMFFVNSNPIRHIPLIGRRKRTISYLIEVKTVLVDSALLLGLDRVLVNATLVLIDETVRSILIERKQNKFENKHENNPPLDRYKHSPYTDHDAEIILGDHGLCPEVYMGSTHGYPFFEKGFAVVNCANTSKLIGKHLSAVFNFAEHPNISGAEIQHIITSFKAIYPLVPIVVAIPDGANLTGISDKASKVDTITSRDSPGTVWNRLIASVRTEFVFIPTGLLSFNEDGNLERLIRALLTLDVPIAGGAIKTTAGLWHMGCVQTVLRNYSLLFSSGYWHSQNECVFCTHIYSPFVAKTAFMLQHKFNPGDPVSTLFTDYFLRLRKDGLHVTVCPDVMFHTIDPQLDNHDHGVWLPMARKYNINVFRFPDRHKLVYSCQELQIQCDFQEGVAIAPCCLSLLSDHVKFLMSLCDSHGIMCELKGYTLLGATKLGKPLPWARDADITVLSSNFSAFVALKDTIERSGYMMQTIQETRCCKDDRLVGGLINILSKTSTWIVHIHGQHKVDSSMPFGANMGTTRLLFDGWWVSAPRNPGRYVRNRFGHEVYRHTDHMMQETGRLLYNSTQGFHKCHRPGAHFCLNRYPADGNLQFQEL